MCLGLSYLSWRCSVHSCTTHNGAGLKNMSLFILFIYVIKHTGNVFVFRLVNQTSTVCESGNRSYYKHHTNPNDFFHHNILYFNVCQSQNFRLRILNSRVQHLNSLLTYAGYSA